MDEVTLRKILADHSEWMADGRPEGDPRRASLSRANLRWADLSGANLSWATLRGANLRGAALSRGSLAEADLFGADLFGADLCEADLSWAVLSDATLAGADLRGAVLSWGALSSVDLSCADLRGADLSDARLRGANMSWASLRGANLRGANLSGADLSGATGLPEAPCIPDLDRRVYAAIQSGGGLELDQWHTCETTHCRAGWYVHLAGEAGYALERQYGANGANVAGALIYRAAYPGRVTPNWFASKEAVMRELEVA